MQAKDPVAAAEAVCLREALPAGQAEGGSKAAAKLRKKQLKVRAGLAGLVLRGVGVVGGMPPAPAQPAEQGLWRSLACVLGASLLVSCQHLCHASPHSCAPLAPSPHRQQELGRARARQLGWQDAYTYSKAIAGKHWLPQLQHRVPSPPSHGCCPLLHHARTHQETQCALCHPPHAHFRDAALPAQGAPAPRHPAARHRGGSGPGADIGLDSRMGRWGCCCLDGNRGQRGMEERCQQRKRAAGTPCAALHCASNQGPHPPLSLSLPLLRLLCLLPCAESEPFVAGCMAGHIPGFPVGAPIDVVPAGAHQGIRLL